MNTVIQSFDNLHDNRILRYCADFECHTLHIVTLSETGESISVRFTGLLAHWFENVIQDKSSLEWMKSLRTDCLNSIKNC